MTQFSPSLSTEILVNGRRMGAWRRTGREKDDKPPLIPILKAPAFRGTEFFVFYSISASCTMATKMSDSHISLWDPNFLPSQLFLTSSSTIHMLFNITETPSASFLHSYQNVSGISSFFSQPRTLDNFTLDTIKPTLSTVSHPPPVASAGAGFLGRGPVHSHKATHSEGGPNLRFIFLHLPSWNY